MGWKIISDFKNRVAWKNTNKPFPGIKIDAVYLPNINRWDVGFYDLNDIYRSGYPHGKVFNTRGEAIKWAKQWMRRHPNG